ncbi:MAG: RNA signal recognition particle [SAR86 cluster bacterium]|uniref:RNA signal recognition particle n=1 Tax=SAR86 cluster bacterium TaxID=2030880 RepID=A0A2A4XA38_9GAMM|nr:MAG: RNA signal recognition particle [SAR86 cluster bacterium]
MSHYIDGFVHPIPRDRLDEYKRLVAAVAKIWKEHGALDYWECVGDDLHLEGTRSFIDLVAATEDEAILFGWVVFDSREARDLVNEKVAADPRMEELMAASNIGFDAQRMAYGGFQPFVSSSNLNEKIKGAE